ncbi:NAD(P)-binding protein [Aaosphaeria arxii CBS 175.79]|uniref:NAD(P)-binding protein n=1 Tax=Aaosphaeria arxii CBS 175.79 TaxID=1450172 RepID=A0A6A5XZE4_9PLEO|nr:NAD(P)-binding protein [Aaosphaeria arxii CBS 175.79]KAF2018665.1 NAD(P)-binding protein [Aaosphaeria arxii CBS 175.79]
MGATFSAFRDQSFRIPAPRFTEKDLPDQTGKVHIVTGGYTGIGLSLTTILYAKNATIYIAGRDAQKAKNAIHTLQTSHPNSTGCLKFLSLDLADLSTIKGSAEEFLRRESRLDVLVNNAGVMAPPIGSKSAQGHDLQTATNVYGPWLFTYFLLPLLEKTAKEAENKGAVRVIWAASLAVELAAPPGGLEFDDQTGLVKGDLTNEALYGQSKVGNVLLGKETAKRFGGSGVVSASFNPGNLESELNRHATWTMKLIGWVLTYPVLMGAYTELFAGWSPEITPENNGCYVIPWGRLGGIVNPGVNKGIESGHGEKLWNVCERVCGEYM